MVLRAAGVQLWPQACNVNWSWQIGPNLVGLFGIEWKYGYGAGKRQSGRIVHDRAQ